MKARLTPRHSNDWLEKNFKLATETLDRRNHELATARRRIASLEVLLRNGSPWQRFRAWISTTWNLNGLEW